jgi:O-antigen/teichoic acid export membrane protein
LNTLGIEDFGIYNIVGSIVVFLSFFKSALTNATYRYLTFELGTGNMSGLKRMFAMTINAHFLLSIFLLIVLEIGGVWFLNNHLNISPDRLPAANWVFQFSLLCFIVEIMKTPYNSLIIAHERMDFYAYVSIVEVIIKLLVVYLLVIADVDRLIFYSILLLGVAVITCLCYMAYCLYYFPESKYKFYWENKTLKQFTSYSGWSLLVNAADISVLQCNNIFLNLFGGVAANAAMGVANQVNTQLNSFLATFSSSYNPQIIKSYAQGNRGYFMQLIFSSSKISYFLLFAVSFPLMINLDFVLRLWLVNPPPMTAVFLRLIIIYSLVDSFSAPLWQAVHATGKLRTHQVLMSSIKVLNIPISYILLKTGHPLSVVLVVYVLLNILCSIVRALYMRKLIALPFLHYSAEVVGRIVLTTILSIPIPLIYCYWNQEGWITLITSTLLFFAVYFVSSFFVGLNDKERKFIVDILKSKIQFM